MTPFREPGKLFEAVFESSPAAMLLVDREGRILRVNAKAAELFGYDAEELAGEEIERLVPPAFRELHRTHREGFVRAPSARSLDGRRGLTARRKDGSEFPAEIGLNPIETQAGLVVLGVVVDLTDRKRTEDRLQAAADDLSRSNAELEQFARVVSHDLQEPLRMVISYVQLLEQRHADKLNIEARRFMRFVVDGAERMRALILDLLDYSRAGTGDPALEAVRLDQVLDEAIRNLRVAIDESGAVIERTKLPTVEGDRIQLVRVFQNLIANAIKFRREDPPRIRITARRSRSVVEIDIADNGIGFEPEFAERVFGVFQRLHTHEYPGTGIGLAICKKLVERHGGAIRVESEPGKGTAFRITLPRKAFRWR